MGYGSSWVGLTRIFHMIFFFFYLRKQYVFAIWKVMQQIA